MKLRYNKVLMYLQNLIKYKPTQKELCEVLQMKQSTLSNRQLRNSEFSDEELSLLEKHYSIEFELSSDVIELDYFPDIEGSCGFGTEAGLESAEKMNITKGLISKYSPQKKYSIINAYGDSMEPFIHDKDMLIVEYLEDKNRIIKDNRIYVFKYGNKIYIKRLVDNITTIIAKSDNKEYEVVKLEKDSRFNLIGQIVGLIRYTG